MTTSRPPLPTTAEIASLPPDGGPSWNRLVFEKSPYLQQHAANPVDWYPWGAEAFDRARREDKPVFLSVGYATCHWCHVMEHESFEDAEVAALMNEHFVCVKVDREERPDIDHVYMTVTQAMTGSGGWPMTVLMTPEKRPFFAGTYFPKGNRYGRPGMMDLVPHVAHLWKTEREKMLDTAKFITGELAKMTGNVPGESPTPAWLHQAFDEFRDRFDPIRGGFGDRPKFPVPHNLMLLLRHHVSTGSKESLKMVEKTLSEMRQGGIFDHVGFGFHRYSTDSEWLVPHFEKMLYDQALMAIAYVETWQVTGKGIYREAAERVFDYVLRDMTSAEGGFFSAEDADSEGEEGKFYVWTEEEIAEILGKDDGALYGRVFGFVSEGNFREESTGALMGVNIPHLSLPMAEVAERLKMEPGALAERLEAMREKLFAVREKRIHPMKDDKILTDWNGLMIAAFAKAAKAFGEAKYEHAARRAADNLLGTLRRADGRLLKRSRHGEAGLPAHLEDYAFTIWGLVDLYEATFEVRYLKAAVELTDATLRHFHDPRGGGFFHTADDGEELLVRSKDIYDGAIPSGNAAMSLNLLRLGRMLARPAWETIGLQTIEAFSGGMKRGYSQFSLMMTAVDFALAKGQEIVLAGSLEEVAPMAARVRAKFRPHTVLLHRPTVGAEAILELVPMLQSNVTVGGKATAYVCENFACAAPTTDAEKL